MVDCLAARTLLLPVKRPSAASSQGCAPPSQHAFEHTAPHLEPLMTQPHILMHFVSSCSAAATYTATQCYIPLPQSLQLPRARHRKERVHLGLPWPAGFLKDLSSRCITPCPLPLASPLVGACWLCPLNCSPLELAPALKCLPLRGLPSTTRGALPPTSLVTLPACRCTVKEGPRPAGSCTVKEVMARSMLMPWSSLPSMAALPALPDLPRALVASCCV
mmetsp:Transcript_6084/g.15092  ORF Transcript_6084/g.15092 Transcript_6084/m.15092 type:complete len:219 (-) Transcript_6084:44-700(-)